MRGWAAHGAAREDEPLDNGGGGERGAGPREEHGAEAGVGEAKDPPGPPSGSVGVGKIHDLPQRGLLPERPPALADLWMRERAVRGVSLRAARVEWARDGR